MSWLPIESAPKDGRLFFAFVPAVGFPVHARFDLLKQRFVAFTSADLTALANGDCTDVTHWQPMPEPPTDDRWELTEAGRAMRGGE